MMPTVSARFGHVSGQPSLLKLFLQAQKDVRITLAIGRSWGANPARKVNDRLPLRKRAPCLHTYALLRHPAVNWQTQGSKGQW